MTDIRELGVGETHLAYPAMLELRGERLGDLDRFVARVDDVQRPQGYRLLAAFDPSERDAAAVAGFRFVSNLAWGDVIYVDDLSSRSVLRRRGYGRALLDAVAADARRSGGVAVHLDSGHHRHDAHRLYLNSGLRLTAHHFARELEP